MAKCYIIRCLACKLLAAVSRRDALTCSGRCRVRLHRHPEILDALRAGCKVHGLDDLFDILEAGAIRELRPDLGDRVLSGELRIADVREDVARAFWSRVMQAARSDDQSID